MSLPTYRSVFAQWSSYPHGFSTRVISPPTMSLLDEREPAQRDQQLPLDVLDGREPQNAARHRAQLVAPQLRQHLFGHRNRSRSHAEFSQSEPDEQRQQRRIGRHLSAERHRNAPAPRRAANHEDDSEDRRMQRLVQP